MTNRFGNHSCSRIFVSTVTILLILIACFIGSEASNASPSESRTSHHVTVKNAVSSGLLRDNIHHDGDVASKTRIINQRAVLQVHVVINGTRGTTQWAVVLDEVTNQASTIHFTQDVHIDWSSPDVSPPHGVADLTFEVPAHPVISRTFLLSLFEKDSSPKLVTRRFATVHATQTPGSSRLVPVLLQGATSTSSPLSTLSQFTTTSNTFLAGLICLGLYFLLSSPSRVRHQTTLQDHDEDDESWIHEDDDVSAEEEDSGYDASVSHEGNPDHDSALDGPSDASDEFSPPTIQRHVVDPSIFEQLEQLGISMPQPSTIATPEYRTPPPNEIPPRHSVFPASPPAPEPLPPACSRQPRVVVAAVDSTTKQSSEEEETASMLTAAASNIGEVDTPATHAGDNASDVSTATATTTTKTLPAGETKQVASQSPLTGITNKEQLANSVQKEMNQRNPAADQQTIGQAIEAEHCEIHRVAPETVVDPECDRHTAEHGTIDEARNKGPVQEELDPSNAADDRQTVAQKIDAEQGEIHPHDVVARDGVDCVDPAEKDTTDIGRKEDSEPEEKIPADERQTVGQAIGAEQSEAHRSMPIQDMDVGCHIASTEGGSNDNSGDAAHQTRESQHSREAKAAATQARKHLRDSDFGVEDEGDKENHETNNFNSGPPAGCAPQYQVPQQTRDSSALQQNTRARPRNLESEARQALHEGEIKAAPVRQPHSPALDRVFASPLPSNREAARIDKSDPNWLQRLSHPKQYAAPAHADVEATTFRTGGTRMTRSKTSEARATVSEQSNTGASAPSSSVFQLPTPIPPAGKVKEIKRVTPKDKNWLQRLRSKPERVTRSSSDAPALHGDDINVEESSYVSTLPSDSETSSVAPDDPFEFLNEGENHEAGEVRIKPATTPSRKRKRGYGSARATSSSVAHTVTAVSTGSSTSTGPGDDDNAVIMWEPTEKEKAVLPRRKKRRSHGAKVVPDSVPSLESVAAKVTAPVWQFNAQEIASVKKDATGNQKRKAKGNRSAQKNRQRGVPDSIKLRRPPRTKKAKAA